MRRKLSVEIISNLLILLFVYTAVSKLLDYSSFKAVLVGSPFIGSYAGIVAVVLPVVELIVALLLFLPGTRLRGLYGSSALMLMFTLYLAYMISFTPHLPCSCGGVLKQMTWNQHLIFNLVFLALSITGTVLQKKQGREKNEREVQSVVYT